MKEWIKRSIDFVFSIILIIILIPIFFALYLLIRAEQGSPVLFKQKRPGKDEKIFTMYKFRTMADKKDEKGQLLPDDQRLTKFGVFLRKTSLDELPEFINILKGDMSFVGPRPLLVRYLKRYNDEQKRRHEVKPGLTGWAQVNGRNAISWEEKFKLDVWYVDHWNLGLDFKILLLTVIKVFKREGISQNGQVTMEEFMGDKCRGIESQKDRESEG